MDLEQVKAQSEVAVAKAEEEALRQDRAVIALS